MMHWQLSISKTDIGSHLLDLTEHNIHSINGADFNHTVDIQKAVVKVKQSVKMCMLSLTNNNK